MRDFWKFIYILLPLLINLFQCAILFWLWDWTFPIPLHPEYWELFRVVMIVEIFTSIVVSQGLNTYNSTKDYLDKKELLYHED